ncbi:hypothetical protein [Bradyrhizobium sp. Ec3.3]|uniref:hypothetical protein n=1 Tax=Bradyrhizobium sp. Ec3.3 TaxID=189753 RepID=UPI000400A217|nr:hypothetical protein [Bradyrhizobium sp. Ec3.3]
MVERVRRYQHNIRAIRAAGCRVPTPHLVDTLDPDTIEAWFAEGAATSARLRRLIAAVAKLPDDTLLPSPFEGSAR